MYAVRNHIIFIISLFLSLKCYSNDTKYFLSELKEPLPTATITSLNQTICTGETALIKVSLTGKGPWNLTFSESSGTLKTITGITESDYQLTVKPKTSTEFFITEVKDQNALHKLVAPYSSLWIYVNASPVFVKKIHSLDSKSVGQDMTIDQVCRDAKRIYRVEGEQGSNYNWFLYNSSNNELHLPDKSGRNFTETDLNGKTHYMNEIGIQWDKTGNYKLKVIQESVTNCDTSDQGFIKVFDQPGVFAGDAQNICIDEKIHLIHAEATNYSSLLWTTAGDGYFDNPTAIGTYYNIGPNDRRVGQVQLTLTAFGVGETTTCTPASSTVSYTFKIIPKMVINNPAPVCAPATIDLSHPDITRGSDTDLGNFEYFADQKATIPLVNYKTVDRAGTYYIRGTNSYSCSVIQPVNVKFNKLITPNFATNNDVCLNSIQQLPSSNFNGITGHWEPSITIKTDVEGEFTYTFKVDPGQCAKDTTILIRVAKSVVPNFSLPQELCLGSVPFVLPTKSIEGVTGTWEPAVVETNQSGTKNYTFTPAAGQCVKYRVDQIRIIDKITPLFGPIGPLCFGQTPPQLQSTSLNGISGTWSPSAIATNKSGISNYTFTPDDNCVVPVTIPIEIYEPITVDVKFDPTPVFGGTTPVTVTASGGSGNGYVGTGVFDKPAGTYTFTVTDDSGCKGEKTINIPQLHSITLSYTIKPMPCVDVAAEVTITASGGNEPYTSYTYTGGYPNIQSVEGRPNVFLLRASDVPYIFEVFDSNGLHGETEPFTIKSPPALLLAHTFTLPICFGGTDGTATVTTTNSLGTPTYVWKNSNNIPLGKTTATATGLKAGTYIVEVTDNCGTKNETVIIPEPDSMSLTAVTKQSICSGNPGSIEFTFTNVPDGVYNILYDGGQFNAVAVTANAASVPAMPGTYYNLKLVINGCSTANGVTAVVSPTPPITINADNVAVTHPTCTTSGAIVVRVPAPGSGYQYSKDDGLNFQASNTFANLATGTYKLRVKQLSTGCVSEPFEQPINQAPNAPSAPVISSIKDTDCSTPLESITLSGLPATGTWKVTTSPGGATIIGTGTTVTFTGLAPNSYTFIVRDDITNCISTPSAKAVINTQPIAPAINIEKLIIIQPNNQNLSGSIIINGPETGTGYVYSINNGVTYQSSSTFSNLSPKIYQLRIKIISTGCESNPLQIEIKTPQDFPSIIKESNSSISKLKVFPNPTTGIINLEISGESNNVIEISVCNLLGVEVFRRKTSNQERFQIDISNLVNGIYMMKITTDNQEYINKIILRKE